VSVANPSVYNSYVVTFNEAAKQISVSMNGVNVITVTDSSWAASNAKYYAYS